jgi:hypothetical protein
VKRSTLGIACWGMDVSGSTSPPAGTFTSVIAGSLFARAVKMDDTVVCWGENESGQATPPAL